MTVPFEIADLFASPFRPEPSPPDRSAPSPDRSGVSYWPRRPWLGAVSAPSGRR